jgi:hypothetical protein
MSYGCKEKSNATSSDFLVFGQFYGECVGENCVQIFKVTQESLYKSDLKQYPKRTEFYNTTYSEAASTYHSEALTLLTTIPRLLKDTVSNTEFGCADCADGGGLYLEYKTGNTHKFWIIDKVRSNISTELHPYVQQVENVLELLINS